MMRFRFGIVKRVTTLEQQATELAGAHSAVVSAGRMVDLVPGIW